MHGREGRAFEVAEAGADEALDGLFLVAVAVGAIVAIVVIVTLGQPAAELDPADVGPVAPVLGELVVDKEVVNGLLPVAKGLAHLLVAVALAGPAAPPGDLLDPAEAERQPDAGEGVRQEGPVGLALDLDVDGLPVEGEGGPGVDCPGEDGRGDARVDVDDEAALLLAPGDALDRVARLVEAAVLPVLAEAAAAVVVGEGAVEVHVRGLGQELEVRAGGLAPRRDCAELEVEGPGRLARRGGDGEERGRGLRDVRDGVDEGVGEGGEDGGHGWGFGERELAKGDAVAGLGPVRVVSEGEVDVQEWGEQTLGDVDFLVAADDHAVSDNVPGSGEVVERDKVVTVNDGDLVVLDVERLHRLDGLAVLNQAGRRGVLGEAETVKDEVVVVGHVAKVAAVGHVLLTFLVFGAKALKESVDVLLDAAGPVAHGVDVLAQHERLAPVPLGGLVDDVVGGGVHAAVDVGGAGAAVALVVDEAGLVDALDDVVHVLVVGAVEGLVAEGPQDDGGVVLVALDHLPRAVLVGLAPVWVVGGPVAGVVAEDAEAVALEIGLVEDPDAELVSQVVQARVVDVVGGADAVDVEMLHQQQVVLEELIGHGAARVRVMLVAVDAAELDWVTIDAEDALDELGATEADALDQAAVFEVEHEGVQVGSLGSPLVRVLDADVEAVVAVKDLHVLSDKLAVGVEELHVDVGAALQLDVDPEGGVLVVVIKESVDVVVDRMELGKGVQVDVPEDAAEPPLVLVLEVGAVAPLVDLDGEHVVLADFDEVRDVELAGVAGALGVADLLAVDPDGEGGINTLEAEPQLVVGKVVPNLERRHVSAALVIIVGDVGSVDGPGEVEIGVLRALAVSLALPHAGDDDVVPFRRVKVGLVKVAGLMEG
ncbi:hypothetical protein ColKHC_07611 [Colletotrichum higginsianum]|nr:hypothetical protein ColKHC_07611 [Colletotrichum higginsianum]